METFNLHIEKAGKICTMVYRLELYTPEQVEAEQASLVRQGYTIREGWFDEAA